MDWESRAKSAVAALSTLSGTLVARRRSPAAISAAAIWRPEARAIAAPSTGNATHYANIIRQKAIVRNLIHVCGDLQREAFDEGRPAQELLDAAESRIFEIAEMGLTGDTKTLKDAVTEAYERMDARRLQGHLEYSGIPTGFTDLDSLTAGMQNSELIIVAARPSVGKTAFALNIARHVAIEENLPVLFVSLEQARIELAERLLCCQSRVDSHHLRRGRKHPIDTRFAQPLLEIPAVSRDFHWPEKNPSNFHRHEA